MAMEAGWCVSFFLSHMQRWRLVEDLLCRCWDLVDIGDFGVVQGSLVAWVYRPFSYHPAYWPLFAPLRLHPFSPFPFPPSYISRGRGAKHKNDCQQVGAHVPVTVILFLFL